MPAGQAWLARRRTYTYMCIHVYICVYMAEGLKTCSLLVLQAGMGLGGGGAIRWGTGGLRAARVARGSQARRCRPADPTHLQHPTRPPGVISPPLVQAQSYQKFVGTGG